jgi:NTE family protein
VELFVLPPRASQPAQTALMLLLVASSLATAGPGPLVPAHPRPRIGLALGGGSARGLAHVGVLEWFAEHRIPIDAIAGTSIGGLLAGTYAVGMTPADIRALVRSTNWDLLFSSDSPFEDKTVRRKQDRRLFPALLELGLRHGMSLPAVLSPSQRVELLIDQIALPYADLKSFDDLPTPFRCVAFDINHAETVVLGVGLLAQAMRATAAIPGLFSPIIVGNRVLVDGGVLDNVPADAVRQMRVDVVIAVNVGQNPATERDVSLVSTLNRTIDAVMAAGGRTSLQSADVVITPSLDGLTSTDWRRHDDLRRRGYEAAAAMQAVLLPYSVDAAGYEAYERERRERRRLRAPTPMDIVVSGVPETDRRVIRQTLKGNLGRPVDADRLAKDILRVTGTDRYEYLTYRIGAGPAGPSLFVDVRPKANGPPFLAVAVDLGNVDASDVAMSVAGRTTLDHPVGAGSEARLDFVVGTQLGASGELFCPVASSPVFVAPRAYVSRANRNGFTDGQLVAEYIDRRDGAGFDVGFEGARRLEVRLGVDLAHASERLRVGDPQSPEVAGAERFVSLQVSFDGQDSASVPSRGVYARGSLRRFFTSPGLLSTGNAPGAAGSPPPFWQAEGEVTGFQPVRDRDRLFLRAAAGTSFDGRPVFEAFSLGGPFRMSAFDNDELRGPQYAMASAGYMKDLHQMPAAVGGRAYVAAWIEAGSAFESRAGAVWHSDASAALIIDSLVGPVLVGGSVGPGGHARAYIALGPLFR